MPESDKHRQLVQQIRAWVECHHPNLAQLIVDDADSYLGRERPPDIDGFRPDAYVPGRNQRVTIVGEAKTAMDLDTQQTREQIALTVAGVSGCDYCASAHSLMAMGAGLADKEVAINLEGQASERKTSAILAFVRAAIIHRGQIGNHDLEALRQQGVSDAELVEVLAHIGINLFTNYFNHVAQTEIDFPFVAANPSESSLNH